MVAGRSWEGHSSPPHLSGKPAAGMWGVCGPVGPGEPHGGVGDGLALLGIVLVPDCKNLAAA